VGETFACGSNACAAAVAGIANGWLTQPVKVDFLYGSLAIDWEGDNQPIHMTGPASRVYSGDIDL
jgi:diaminopimelate epimerase